MSFVDSSRSSILNRLEQAVDALPVIDTHEHCWKAFCAAEAGEFDLPFFVTNSYVLGDLMTVGFRPASGMFDYLRAAASGDDPQGDGAPSGAAGAAHGNADARMAAAWRAVRPCLRKTRNTFYYRYLLDTLKMLVGAEEGQLYSEGWRDVSNRLRGYSRRMKGRAQELFLKAGIRATVLDAKAGPGALSPVDFSEHKVLQVARMGMFIHEQRGLRAMLARFPSRSLEDWTGTFDNVFAENLKNGAAGFKLGLAYNRRIEFSDPKEHVVSRLFRRGILEADPRDRSAFEDFMVNRLCRLCVENDVPLQIHSGLHSGVGKTLEDSKPTLLTSLFQRHGDLRVDLFHGGYPWTREAGLMAKYFPNVHLNGCWLHHVSPSAYRTALRSWIEIVPMSKIFAWGGDHGLAESSLTSLRIARRLATETLSGLVGEDYMDFDLAVEIARRIFHDNPAEFWRLDSEKTS